MSIQAREWAWSQTIQNPVRKFVLVTLGDFANDDGVCWPNQKTLADRCGMTVRGVRGALDWLEDNRFISRVHRPGHGAGRNSDVYTLEMTQEERRSPCHGEQPECGSPCQTRQPERDAGQPERRSPKQKITEIKTLSHAGARACEEPPSVQEPAAQPPPSQAPPDPEPELEPEPGLSLPAWLPADAWTEFVEHRREAQKAMTGLAARKMLKRLGDLRAEGHDPVKLIDLAIASGWLNVFPRDETRSGVASTAPGHVSSTQNHTAHGGKHETYPRRYQSVVSRQAEIIAQRERERQRREREAAGYYGNVFELPAAGIR